MFKMLSALIFSLGISVSVSAYAECPVPVSSEVHIVGQGTSGENIYNFDGHKLVVDYTNIPWRMTHSNMFLSGLMGKHWYVIEHDADKIVFGAYENDELFMLITENDGFIKITTGDNYSFSKGSSINIANEKTCFKRFIKVK